jgi:hypothetical protein
VGGRNVKAPVGVGVSVVWDVGLSSEGGPGGARWDGNGGCTVHCTVNQLTM